jgi:hypothetical protein
MKSESEMTAQINVTMRKKNIEFQFTCNSIEELENMVKILKLAVPK